MGSREAFAHTTHFVTSAISSGVLRPPYFWARYRRIAPLSNI
jgi:hypothetical protein